MEFRDLKKQYQVLKKDIDEAVTKVMVNCNFIIGQEVKDFEHRLASYVGMKHCVSCGNGTDALELVLMAWGVGKGDAVFIPDFTFFSTGEVVALLGATPVFVDVRKDTYTLDPKKLEEAIEKVIKQSDLKLKVVIPVDLFGLPYDVDAINAIAHNHGMKVLEDGAQGFGGMYNKRRTCSFGDAATTSFFPAKPLGCYGDGGAIFVNDDETAELLESYRVHGKSKTNKYDNLRLGMNSRLDTIQAAILNVKMDAFEKNELEAVNNVYLWYNEALKGNVITPVVSEGFYSSWAQYTIQLKGEEKRNKVQTELKKQGIPTMVYYQKPMHLQKAFDSIPKYTACPETDLLCKTVLSLPMHPYMTKENVVEISEKLITVVKHVD